MHTYAYIDSLLSHSPFAWITRILLSFNTPLHSEILISQRVQFRHWPCIYVLHLVHASHSPLDILRLLIQALGKFGHERRLKTWWMWSGNARKFLYHCGGSSIKSKKTNGKQQEMPLQAELPQMPVLFISASYTATVTTLIFFVEIMNLIRYPV